MKVCFVCKASKPLDAFYKHAGMADGRLGKCIECTKEYINTRRRELPEHVRAIDNQRAKSPERRQKQAGALILHRARHPEKNRARQAIARALLTGSLVKPPQCSRCPCAVVEAHHPDYTKPLEVLWLCRRCHRAEHGTLVDAPETTA